MTGLKLFLLVLLALSVSYKTTAEQQPAVSIGGISELKGDASVLRDQPYGAESFFFYRTNGRRPYN